jgi:hypothetical protein
LEVFVGGYRLKKVPYKLFQETNGYPYSPEGDAQFEAEFSVNGSSSVRITNDYPEHAKIVVIKKTGRVWEDADNPVEIFRNIQAPFGGGSFDIFKTNTAYTVNLKNAGQTYEVGDTFTLAGSLLGGQSPQNDIDITVTGVAKYRGENLASNSKLYPGSGIFDAAFIGAGATFVIESTGTTDFTAIGASSNEPGTVFVATGPGTGTGTAFALLDHENPNEITFTMNFGVPNILWKNKYFEGNGATGYITEVGILGDNTFTVLLDNPLIDYKSIPVGNWKVFPLKEPLSALNTFTFKGTGQENGFVAKSLVDSSNPIADFIKNTETVWPSYITGTDS